MPQLPLAGAFAFKDRKSSQTHHRHRFGCCFRKQCIEPVASFPDGAEQDAPKSGLLFFRKGKLRTFRQGESAPIQLSEARCLELGESRQFSKLPNFRHKFISVLH
jgi:hypothetical protein